jgi:hypothetical protein
MWGKLRRYVIVPFATSLVLGLLSYAFENESWAARAYVAVESFAPWNLATGYFKFLTISDDPSSEFPALRAFEPAPTLGNANPATGIPTLSRGANYFLRPLTALVDVLLHLFFGLGVIGFLVSVGQVALGAGLMLILSKGTAKGLYFYAIVLPVGAVLLGSAAAIPIWLIALLGLLFFNSAITVGVQSGSTAFALMWVRDRALEAAAHETVSKGVAQVVSKVEKALTK